MNERRKDRNERDDVPAEKRDGQGQPERDGLVDRVVYGTCQADGVLRFVPPEIVDELMAVRTALATCRDWGELRIALPADRWEELVEHHEDELPADTVLLSDAIPMDADDDWWPAFSDSGTAWIPEEARAIGRYVATALDGAVFGCPEEREAAIVLAFLHDGFEIARDDSAIEVVCGLSNAW